MSVGLRLLEDIEASRERWLRREIPVRMMEMRDDPSIRIPAEQVFAELEARQCSPKPPGQS